MKTMINVCFSDYVSPLICFLDGTTAVRLFKFAYIVPGVGLTVLFAIYEKLWYL